MAARPVLASRRPERSFERLYQEYVGDVYRYALAVTGNASDAEDVAQTTFMNAYRAYERGERPLKAQNWLITIAHNVCRQRARQSSRRPSEVRFEEDVAEAIVPSEDAPTAGDIQRALGHLAFNQRAALVMRELEGRTHAEIAEALGLTVAATEMLVFRARRALREQLAGSLTCDDAEAAISRQRDGRLSRDERGALRAHLRECEDCARIARRQRAQRSAWKALAAAPLPASLSSFMGGGGAALVGGGGAAAIGTGLALKAVAVTVAAVAVAGGGYEAARHTVLQTPHHPVAGSVVAAKATHAATTHRTGKSALTAASHRATHHTRGAGTLTPAAASSQAGAAGGQAHSTPRAASATAHGLKRATPTKPLKPHRKKKHHVPAKKLLPLQATTTPAGIAATGHGHVQTTP